MGKGQGARDSKQLAKEEGKRKILSLLDERIYVKSDIARRLGLSYSTASDWVDEIYSEWVKENKEDASIIVQRQLREIDWSRREAVVQWERSKQDTVSITEKLGKDGAETSTNKKGQCGDPRYLIELRELRAEERAFYEIGVDGKNQKVNRFTDMSDEELDKEIARIANMKEGK